MFTTNLKELERWAYSEVTGTQRSQIILAFLYIYIATTGTVEIYDLKWRKLELASLGLESWCREEVTSRVAAERFL